MPDRKFESSLAGRLLWEPGDPHALDQLFTDAQAAQQALTQALTTLQQLLATFPQHEVVTSPEILQVSLTTEETKGEETAWARLG